MNFVNRYRCKNGAYRWLEWRAAPSGKINYAAARDITESKKAEERIRLHETRLKNLLDLHKLEQAEEKEFFDFTLDASLSSVQSEFAFVGTINEDESILTIQAWSKGVMGQCAIAEKIIQFLIADLGLLGEVVRQRRPIIVNDYETSAELKKGCPMGHVPIKRFLCVPVFRADRIVAVAAVANKVLEYNESDISSFTSLLNEMWNLVERRRAAEALKKSEERYRIVADFTYDWEFWLSPDDRFLYSSPSCQRVTGYPATDFGKGPDFTDRLVYPDDRELFNKHRHDATTRKIGEEMEFRIIRPDGSVRWISHVCQPVFDRKGQFLGTRGSNRDITERKRAEEERIEMERHLLHAQKLESIGMITGGIAHDFNNILMGIIGNLSLSLMKLPATSPVYPFLEQAINSSQRAADLVRQMLTYVGKSEVALSDVDLTELVKENSEMLRTVVSKTVVLDLQLSAVLPVVKADAGQIYQVIVNLVTNASEAMGEQAGLVVLSTGMQECDEAYLGRSRIQEKPAPGRFIFLEVSDTGSGMDEETQQKLFEPFFTTKFLGRGLGMAAVQGIVRGHKGAIIVDSEVGKGTVIRALFPVSQPE